MNVRARRRRSRAPGGRRLCATLVVGAATAAAALCGPGAVASGAAPQFPTHVCGHFLRSGQDFIVYSGGGISCAHATGLIKGFVLGDPTQHGSSDANSYWTIPGEAHFRCIESMGQGECFGGARVAGYRIKA